MNGRHRPGKACEAGGAAAALAVVFSLAACDGVRRTITITSDPDGALVWLNDREVGRTPVDVDFLYYGRYDVRLARDGYEPLLTSGEAKPPLWDVPPFDLVAELAPGEPHSAIQWHYVLSPSDDDPAALLGRASEMRSQAAMDDNSSAQTSAP